MLNTKKLSDLLEQLLPMAADYSKEQLNKPAKIITPEMQADRMFENIMTPSKNETEFSEALNTLSEDELLSILCVMYVGRDSSEDTPQGESLNMFTQYMKDFKRWNKLQLVDQIVGKVKVGRYLTNGKEYLGI